MSDFSFIDKKVLLATIDAMKYDEYIFGTSTTMKEYFKQIINVMPCIEVKYNIDEVTE